MCDYSLGGLPSRLAVEGEELMVHRFPTHSIGLASAVDFQPKSCGPAERNIWRSIRNFFVSTFDCPKVTAVCVPPGAFLILRGIPADLQEKWNVGQEEGVRFAQTGVEVNTYRDAFSFRNGRQVSLQHLREGMPVKLVSLGDTLTGDQDHLAAGRVAPAFRH